MQIKTTMRYHFTSIRMAVIKEKRGTEKERKQMKDREKGREEGRKKGRENRKQCWHERRETGNFVHWLLVGTWNNATAMENVLVIPQKIKNRITTWPSNSTSGYIRKRTVSRASNRCICTFTFIAALLATAKMWDSPSTHPWMPG